MKMIQVQGYYGITPFGPQRTWMMWGNVESLDYARRTIASLGVSDKITWRQPNGWRIVDVDRREQVIENGRTPDVIECPAGMEIDRFFEVQGLYHNRLPGGEGHWEVWRKFADLERARTAARTFGTAKKIQGISPSDKRMVAVTCINRIIEMPDVADLPQHWVPPAPDLQYGSIVYHVEGQPAGLGAHWGEDGYHYDNKRRQYGPLPKDAHHLRVA